MRDNFDRFGGFVSINVMKQGLEKFLWTYVSVTMYNEVEQVCVGCEGIVCSKRYESYIEMINIMI